MRWQYVEDDHGEVELRIYAGERPGEKQIRKWARRWKIELIQKTNPVWRDLYADVVGQVLQYGFPLPRE